MAAATVKGRLNVALAIAMLAVALLGSLVLMSAAIQNSARFGTLFSVLLLTNGCGLLLFIVLIVHNVRRLLGQLRRREPGARLTLRLMLIFVTLAVIPLVILYSFSLDFLRRGIDSWFDIRIDVALEDSLELGQAALDIRMRELLRQTEQVAEEIASGQVNSGTTLNLDVLRSPDSLVVSNAWSPPRVDLDGLRTRSGAEELSLLARDGRVLESSSAATDIVPRLPAETILVQPRQGRGYIGLEPIADRLFVRVAVRIPDSAVGANQRLLHALYPISKRMNELADSVESAYAQYTELNYLRDKLKLSFAMTLTLVLLSSIVMAVWAALYSARRLAEPIRDLVAGTAAVAAGNYETSLPVQSSDDVGFLVQSFNEMTRRISIARAEVETQREYLDTVLAELSSGVLALNEALEITTVNSAARAILDIGDADVRGRHYADLARRFDHVIPFTEILAAHVEDGAETWQQQTVIFRPHGRRVLMCRGRGLSDARRHGGTVVVFDDITALIQGQRDAAWSEVARRLAHEIKNPLTPIQLSAERLRHKYLKVLPPDEAATLDRLTNTIVQQVDTMKAMVNTFSDYARPPQMSAEATDLNDLLEGVIELFRSARPDARFETDLDPHLPQVVADPARLRQVFNNLVKNATESSRADENPHIIVATRKQTSDAGPHIEIRIEDRGEGIPTEMFENIFEPYVTSKSRGTGLGLAIVKKIIEEHGGVVDLQNNAGPGAAAVIRLPVEIAEAEMPASLARSG